MYAVPVANLNEKPGKTTSGFPRKISFFLELIGKFPGSSEDLMNCKLQWGGASEQIENPNFVNRITLPCFPERVKRSVYKSIW